MNTNKTLLILDASLLKHSACNRFIILEGVQGYQAKKTNNDIHWGSAFHKFRAVYRSTNNWSVAVKEAIDYFKNDKHVVVKPNKKYLTQSLLLDACMKYESKYHVNKDTLVPGISEKGDPLIEPLTRFSLPLFIDEHCEILLAGTMDEVGYQHGSHFVSAGYRIVDCKTSGTWKIQDYMEGYRLSTQMLTYRSAIRRYAKLMPQSIWKTIDASNPRCIIDGVFHSSKDVESEDQKGATIRLHRSDDIVFCDWQIDEFDMMLERTVKRIVEHIHTLRKTGNLPPREGLVTDSCDTKYGRCKFANVCVCVDDEQRDSVLAEHFTQKQYNPLNFN